MNTTRFCNAGKHICKRCQKPTYQNKFICPYCGKFFGHFPVLRVTNWHITKFVEEYNRYNDRKANLFLKTKNERREGT